ncbi:hypothetical protein CKF54_06125 [Psittacicella hinzii]|uniref:Type I restriction modification DNA specificity domain-containing protein n=1 Tax=Psittacicella hinzii TaxID=2028575 RepID=A0A3A1Y2V9_9GAMM|nr:restriction endonuclease subunit S [Psittacicella hinzii]RIY31760.1 hypothetical protein CKF54_06125 [Psittacicella hinzii]
MQIPKLSFTKDNSPLTHTTLKEIADFSLISLPSNKYFLDEGKYSIVTIAAIGLDGRLKKLGFFADDDRALLKSNDIVISLSGSCGRTAFVMEDNAFVVNQRVGTIRIKDTNKVDPYYIHTQFSTHRILKYLYVHSQGTAQANISKPAIENTPLILHSFEEQQKISKLFRDIDELLILNQRYIEKCHKLKEALIQRLYLPNLEEKHPKVRFKGFTEDWLVAPLKNLSTINPKGPKVPDRFIYIDLEAVKGTLLLKERIEYKETAPSRAQRVAQKNDIFFQLVRTYQKNNYFFEKDSEVPYVFSTGYGQIRVNPEHDPYFIFTALQSFDAVKRIVVESNGTAYPAINATNLSKIKIGYSPNIEEQKKISKLIKTVDHLIGARTKQFNDLRTLKRGLLQQLFV